jgi:hypothetical protein
MGPGDSVGPCSCPRPEPVSLRPELVEGRIPSGATSSDRKTPRNSRNIMKRALPFCRSVALSEQGAQTSQPDLTVTPETPS